MSFAATTSARRNLRPRYWLEVQGVEQVLVEQAFAPTDVVSGRTQLVVVPPEGISFGEARLDFEQLAESGASLTVQLRDDVSRHLAALFAMRTRRVTRLAASVARTDALNGGGGDELEVEDNTGLPTSGTCFIAAETLTWTGKSGSTTLTGVARARYGSRAQTLVGGAEEGMELFLVPPAWFGRRVTLKAVYLGDSGAPMYISDDEDDDSVTLGTFLLEAPPQFVGGGEWELQCGPLHERFARAPLYRGQRPVRAIISGTSLAVGDAAAAFFAEGTAPTNVKLTFQDGRVVLPSFEGIAGGVVTIDDTEGPVISPNGLAQNAVLTTTAVESAQQVAYLTGDATRILLQLLLSRLGDEANTDYDVLPGVERTGYGETEWSFGAGIEADDIDVESFEAFIGDGPTWTLLLDEQLSVADVLVEWCRSVRAFWRVTAEGVLAASRLREKSTSAAESSALVPLDDDALIADDDEVLQIERGAVSTSVKLSANWDPLSGQHLAIVDVTDHELAALYPELEDQAALESRVLTVSTPAVRSNAGTLARAGAITVDDVRIMLRRAQVSSTRARCFTQQRYGWDAFAIAVGDIVRVENARVPDLRGAMGLAVDALVVGRQLDVDTGVVTLRCLLVDRGFRIAPAGVIASWNAGTKTATLDNSDPVGSSQGRFFAAGWSVEMLDVSATPDTVATLTIASVTDDTITFTAAPGFTPAAGDVILPTPQAGQTVGVSGLSPLDYIFGVPDDGTLGVTDFEDPRWS